MGRSGQYAGASVRAANDLRTVARSSVLSELSQLSVREVDTVVALYPHTAST